MRTMFSRCLLMVMVIAVLACRGGHEPEPEPKAKLNVVIVLVDALRADRLGPYGFIERSTTPELDRFAAESVVFENAISQCGWTVPSVATLFTGVYPQTHGVLRFVDPKANLEEDSEGAGGVMMDAMSMGHQTLAEQFSTAGYETAAILKSDVINAGRGFDQGFEHFKFVDSKPKERGESGAQLTDAVFEWFEGRRDDSRPFFLYLHYMDSHASYQAPEPFYSKYIEGIDSPLDGSVMEVRKFNDGLAEPTSADVEKLLSLYDAEIEYWDQQFGRLINYLKTQGVLESTIVVVTSDHGEAFNEHGRFLHADIFMENIQIPMIIRCPGFPSRSVDGWMQMIDLPSTLVDLADVPRGAHWVGRSQAGTVRGQSGVVRGPVFSEWAGKRCVFEPGGLKLLLVGGETLLFDLIEDPGETVNLADDRPEDVARLLKLLQDWQKASKSLGDLFPRSEAQELSPEQVEALKALGYL